MSLFTNKDQKIIIPGPQGDLEALALGAKQETPKAMAIICHPHPLQEGTMNNKVVYVLARVFADMGLHTIRFNYRGVGESAGHYGHGEGETEDCLAVMDWAKQHYPGLDFYLSGFSFGSYVSANAAHQRPHDVLQLVNIAPAVTLFDFTRLTNIDCPWLVVQGDEDSVVDLKASREWAAHMRPKPNYIIIPGAGHFFHSRLLDLRHVLELELT
ncbi:MAG: alpha/beta hydrolase [Legionellaceae bacterium]|nr:alpha/beta hydrolase [Legionellaceae bacterium]|tara:strand:- start:945 stop:1583 length:639 start_codon:yes stop_codon:yes gene_type:complete